MQVIGWCVYSYFYWYSCSNTTYIVQVELELFPEMRGEKLQLRSVKIDEALVTDYVDRAMELFKLNTVGPQKYIHVIIFLIFAICFTCMTVRMGKM